MQTILVIYSFVALNKKQSQTLKRYSFNTSAKLKVGDRFESEDYNTPMQVVEIFDTCYKYVDVHSGELSNKRKASTMQYEIRELVIKTKRSENAIEAELI